MHALAKCAVIRVFTMTWLKGLGVSIVAQKRPTRGTLSMVCDVPFNKMPSGEFKGNLISDPVSVAPIDGIINTKQPFTLRSAPWHQDLYSLSYKIPQSLEATIFDVKTLIYRSFGNKTGGSAALLTKNCRASWKSLINRFLNIADWDTYT